MPDGALQRRVEVLERQMAELVGSRRVQPGRLTDDEVRDIRSRALGGEYLAELAREYGRSRRTIAQIRDRVWYAGIPD